MLVEQPEIFLAANSKYKGVKADSFTLENVLGSGGFGSVYFTHGQQGQPMAVKVLFPPRSLERADMADYTSRLSHLMVALSGAVRSCCFTSAGGFP